MTDEISKALKDLQFTIEAQNARQTGTLPVPAIINDTTADPALRSAALDAYTTRLTNEIPAERWTAEQRRAVEQRIQQVLREGGFN
jgi:predicted deacylase